MEPTELALSMADSRPIHQEDRSRFEELLVRHQRLVLSTAWRVLGNLDDARDAAQEVFLKLHKHRDQWDESRGLAAWLYRVTVNACYDLRRRRVELPLADSMDVPYDAPPADELIDLETRKRLLREGLKRLTEKERAAVVLRDIEGLSAREAAEILGSSEVTVRAQAWKARLKLKKFCDRALRSRL